MGHQGSDVPVTQVKYPFNDFLFGFIDSSLFGSFIDDRLDLVFRNITIGRRLYRKYFKKQVGGAVQDQNNRVGYLGNELHRRRHDPGNFFRTYQANPFGINSPKIIVRKVTMMMTIVVEILFE